MRCVSFLPQELSRSNEWSRMLKLPSNHIWPLIHFQWQISVGVDPFCEGRIHNGFTGWTDCNWFWQLTLSALGNPSDFRWEAFNMIFLFVQGCLCHKHWEVAILHANLFNSFVNKLLDVFPDEVRQRSKDVAPWNVVVLNHLSLGNYLRVPLREV